jgi:hypothetical protein
MTAIYLRIAAIAIWLALGLYWVLGAAMHLALVLPVR